MKSKMTKLLGPPNFPPSLGGVDLSNPFFDHPILNSPYDYPRRHWELDELGHLILPMARA
jgi:hypothetical protein